MNFDFVYRGDGKVYGWRDLGFGILELEWYMGGMGWDMELRNGDLGGNMEPCLFLNGFVQIRAKVMLLCVYDGQLRNCFFVIVARLSNGL
jgi:hypothetical protein